MRKCSQNVRILSQSNEAKGILSEKNNDILLTAYITLYLLTAYISTISIVNSIRL